MHNRPNLCACFATSKTQRKDARPPIKAANDIRVDSKPPGNAAELTPETRKRSDSPAATTKISAKEKSDPLLGAENVSNKEQRKADWAIIKEMTRYLWPKVFILL